ncbi:PAS domain-containing sensor histidine kinase [Chamaesiphon sp.]|uniref:PAS domain-containing sensor histidine kinase n=1 Tax=Chamaesiphon sp. TaxID=2814140 RepID=UPI0035931909
MTIDSFIFYLCGYRTIAELNLAIEFSQAIEWYDRAIAEAKTNQCLEQEAIANECAAKFCREWSQEKIAATYMQAADDCYAQACAIDRDRVAQTAVNIPLKQSHLEILLKDRQAMEIALRESEERYCQMVSNVPGTLYQFELSADGTYKLNYLSARFAELFEISPAAALADVSILFDRVLPEDRAGFERSLQASAGRAGAWVWEGRISTSSAIKWIRGESRPILADNGAIVWDGILMDITKRKQTEIALRQSEQRYQKLADNIPGVIYQFRLAPDGSNTYLYMSSGCFELFHLTSEALMADSTCLLDLIHPDDLPKLHRVIAESAQNMTPKLWEGRAILSSGEIKWVKSASRPELQPDGAIVWDGVLLDITDRKQVETELHQTNHRLELTNTELQRATRLKDEFLANMSHELRTPLNAILGMSEALQEELFGALNSSQLNAIATIEQSGQHLLSLINDILDVSKISAGKLELNITEVSLTELCRSSLILVKQQAIDRQIYIDTHLPSDLDRIVVDERRMRQVLINLLNNAVKFTAKGGLVTLSVRLKPLEVDGRQGDWLCFSVTDTGIGIDSADRSKLFQPFIQLDSSLNRKYPGTGLGLVLVKQIVELHGGDVTLDSQVGVGSCFTVTLPQPDLTPFPPKK